MMWIKCAIPEGLRGRIITRQTTFLEVLGTTPTTSRFRIHFHNKLRHMLEYPEFDSIQVFNSNHPVLIDYQEPFATLQVLSKHQNPAVVVEAITGLIRDYYNDWQHYDEYRLRVNAPVEVLTSGNGFLLFAPAKLVDQAATLLSKLGVKTSVLPRQGQFSSAQVLALILGKNYVIAESFRTEAFGV